MIISIQLEGDEVIEDWAFARQACADTSAILGGRLTKLFHLRADGIGVETAPNKPEDAIDKWTFRLAKPHRIKQAWYYDDHQTMAKSYCGLFYGILEDSLEETTPDDPCRHCLKERGEPRG